MFEHLTLTLAQDAPPPPPVSSTPAGAPSGATSGGPSMGSQVSGGSAGEQQPLPAAKGPGFGDPIMIVALAVLAFMFFFTISSSRKEKKRKAALVSSLKKGSKVRTIGGIIGTVAELREDNTVVVKVDENTNTRMKFDRNAIASVIEEKGD